MSSTASMFPRVRSLARKSGDVSNNRIRPNHSFSPLMKYILLVHVSPDSFEAPKQRALAAAGRAYAEALQAAGVFIAGVGLQSPEKATTVSVRDGKRQVQDGP